MRARTVNQAPPLHRCQHRWCNDCRKKRGRNFGNRRIRRAIHVMLRQERKST